MQLFFFLILIRPKIITYDKVGTDTSSYSSNLRTKDCPQRRRAAYAARNQPLGECEERSKATGVVPLEVANVLEPRQIKAVRTEARKPADSAGKAEHGEVKCVDPGRQRRRIAWQRRWVRRRRRRRQQPRLWCQQLLVQQYDQPDVAAIRPVWRPYI